MAVRRTYLAGAVFGCPDVLQYLACTTYTLYLWVGSLPPLSTTFPRSPAPRPPALGLFYWTVTGSYWPTPPGQSRPGLAAQTNFRIVSPPLHDQSFVPFHSSYHRQRRLYGLQGVGSKTGRRHLHCFSDYRISTKYLELNILVLSESLVLQHQERGKFYPQPCDLISTHTA